jgi:hypothetical protein
MKDAVAYFGFRQVFRAAGKRGAAAGRGARRAVRADRSPP